jgi:beta-phosphoglucomutase
MSSWPAAVLFDFDGVIVNSEPLHLRAFQQVLDDERISLTEEQYYSELIGFDDRGAFRRVFELHGRALDPKTFLRLMTRKSEAMRQLIDRRAYAPLPGVEQFIRGLWRDRPLGICSGALREEIELMLEGVALRDCFTVIVSAEDVTRGKPDPQGYLLTAQLLSEKMKRPLKPSDCLVVEDAPTVIRSVRTAGFKVLGVATTYFIDRLADADYATRTLQPSDVLEAVPQLKPLFAGVVG